MEVLRNASEPSQHWFELLLSGKLSNRDGIGAKVRLVSPSGRAQYNHVTTSVGYASSSSRRVHFGLGDEPVIASLEIQWPSGTIQRMQNVRADRCLPVTEPPTAAR